MPYIARILSSETLRQCGHRLAETKAKLTGQWPVIEIYLHAKDPWSYLLLQALPNLQERYKVDLKLYWLHELQSDMFPEPDLLQDYAAKDCEFLATTYHFSPAPRMVVDDSKLHGLSCKLQQICGNSDSCIERIVTESLALIGEFSAPNKQDIDILEPNVQRTDTVEKGALEKAAIEKDILKEYSPLLISNSQRQNKLGHYAPATLYFAGEWYWGIDRINHLERRLNRLNLNTNNPKILFDKHQILPDVNSYSCLKNKNLVLYWSARSPYSYLALIRCIDLAKKYQFDLTVKPVMPMMMRNLSVPNAKKMYIFKDTKREANKNHIKYGYVADPLGIAVVRCYALLDYARKNNRYLEFLVSFSKAVNSEGIRAQSDKGLKIIIERAGMNWQHAKTHLSNQSWQQETQDNLSEMTSRGLWGVPSLAFEQHIVWGQDRIPFILNKMAKVNH